MRRFHRPPIVAAALLVLGVVVGCQPPAASPALTDAREIVTRGIATTAALRTATVHADLEVRIAADPEFQAPAHVEGGSIEGEMDLATGSVHARGTGRDGVEAFEMVMVGEDVFLQMAMLSSVEQDRWMAMPRAGGGPAGLLLGMPGAEPPDYAAILLEAMAGDGVTADLIGTESCPSGTCYRVEMAIAPDVTWPLFSRLIGLDRIPEMNDAPPDGDLPEVALVVWVDTAALYVVALEMAGSTSGDTFRSRLELSRPNAHVSIEAPPAHLVDSFGDELNGVGEPIPEPMPPEPGPVETIPALDP